MNNRSPMDQFIKFIAQIKYENPDLVIDKNLVYGELTRIGISPKHRKEDLSTFFPRWIERFKNVSNIDVKNTENWKYFCQFNNIKDLYKYNTFIKIYIPMDTDMIYEGVNTLFDFLAKENIEHTSKVGKGVRNDDVVVRVTSVKSAQKVEQFIRNNPIFSKSKIKPSPFAINNGQCAYVTDADISYNSEVATLISEYIGDLPKDRLKSANINEFCNFVNNYYNSVFVSKNKDVVSKFEKNRKLEGKLPNKRNITKYNYLEMSKNIIAHLKGTLSIQDIVNTFNTINNRNDEEVMEMFSEKLEDTEELDVISDTEELINIPKLLEDIIMTNYNKYGLKQTTYAFKNFITGGGVQQFTRDNDSRKKIEENFKPSDLVKYLEEEYGSLDIESLISKAIIEFSSIKYLEKASLVTLKKYDEKQLAGALAHLGIGDFKRFTNEDNARTDLATYFDYKNSDKIIKKTLLDNGIKVDDTTDIKLEYVMLMNKKLEAINNYEGEKHNTY